MAGSSAECMEPKWDHWENILKEFKVQSSLKNSHLLLDFPSLGLSMASSLALNSPIHSQVCAQSTTFKFSTAKSITYGIRKSSFLPIT